VATPFLAGIRSSAGFARAGSSRQAKALKGRPPHRDSETNSWPGGLRFPTRHLGDHSAPGQGQHQRTRAQAGDTPRQRAARETWPAAASGPHHRPHAATHLHLDDVRRRRGTPVRHRQVGRDDSKVTLEIYAQCSSGRDRKRIGRAFDDVLVGQSGKEDFEALTAAREFEPSDPEFRADRAESGPTAESEAESTATWALQDASLTRGLQVIREVELGGLEPPTSWVRSRRSPN
jgi:hypothetical protein